MCVQTHGGFGFAEEYRHRAQVPRDAAVSGGADLDQLDPVLSRRACARVAAVVLIMTLPLEGLLVVALEQAVAAPQCTCRLADAGARRDQDRAAGRRFRARLRRTIVPRRERQFRLAQSRQGIGRARSRASDDDKALLAAMLAKADVFVQNLKPGAMAKLGFPVARAAQEASEADLLFDLGLWRDRPLRAAQGLRPAGPGRSRACVGHRRAGGAGAALAFRLPISVPA